ncbi:MAG: hypothetical protein QOH86_1211 [Sphingomonadales bacterium]|nr:hypothetical protein [Sphingomonadales bacterium]
MGTFKIILTCAAVVGLILTAYGVLAGGQDSHRRYELQAEQMLWIGSRMLVVSVVLLVGLATAFAF